MPKKHVEQDIQKDILDYLRSVGALPFKQNQIGIYAEKGVPDILACYCGRFIAIEVKIPGKKPTKIQQHYLDTLDAIGGFAIRADCVDDVEHLIAYIDDKIYWEEYDCTEDWFDD
jgi:Holliday junction resolvase